jgi:ketosteroid isomerase-like protein
MRKVMSEEFALPIADPVTSQSIFEWLQQFATCVREVDYAAARPFWHPDIIVFGTYQELVHGCSRWTETQWDNVWPRTADFAFDLENTAVLTSPDGAMATVITPWTSTGFHADGSRFDRPGRATIILARHPDGHWLGVHSHMSLQRGVPQDSHGNRPVKAR